ncbi:MAG: hypothetical protein ACI8Y7_000084 [Candidatus Woesearchaeota archaeon]|jgi:hypothetical protein
MKLFRHADVSDLVFSEVADELREDHIEYSVHDVKTVPEILLALRRDPDHVYGLVHSDDTDRILSMSGFYAVG